MSARLHDHRGQRDPWHSTEEYEYPGPKHDERVAPSNDTSDAEASLVFKSVLPSVGRKEVRGSAGFRSGMGIVVGLLHSLGGEMRIDLGRGEALVTQQLLDAPEIGTVVQKVRGETVSEGVR